MQPNAPPCHLLLVEDNDDDAFAFTRAAQKVAPDVTIARCKTVSEAQAYLTRAAAAQQAPQNKLPELVVSDLRLGIKSGFELLRWVRIQEQLRGLPLIFLSGMPAPDAVERAYNAGANAVILKPIESEKLREVIRALVEFWCYVTERPTP